MRWSPSAVTLLTALLVVVTVAGAGSALATAVADGPETVNTVTVDNDTVGRLTVSDSTTTTQRVTADLSGALADDRQQVRTALSAGEFKSAFESAPNRSAKLAVVDAALDRLETRARDLRADRETAIRSFARDEVTSSELFRELTRVYAAAEGIDERATAVETTVEESTEITLSERLTRRLAGIDGEIVSLQGPITDRVTESVRRTTEPLSISLRAGQTGAVFATIEGATTADPTFVREAALWSERAESGPDQFAEGETVPLTVAYQQARETYPWAVENLVSGLSVTGFGESPIYAVQLTHNHGDLETYLDGRTTNVFYEVQRLQLSRLPTETTATNTTEDLRIEVNATAVGPQVVTVRNATTGEAVVGEITVETTSGTRSAIDSRLWLYETDAERTITAQRPDGTTVSVTVGA